MVESEMRYPEHGEITIACFAEIQGMYMNGND